ncbi:MAG: isoprenylcysteine carboxylmethyltransferase family protein [Lachnospiraceae bacterium]|nr:isoprenylcysteine carboxylmethyltransferase family protein [Lachnospiraceae bacterium]
MNGSLLLIPFLMIRFGLLFILNPQSIQRAAYFAPVQGSERIAYYIYQVSNIGIFIYLFFLKFKIDFSWQFYLGIFCYIAGLGLCVITIVNFSAPDENGLNINGIYRYSRNPMYVAYFICFLGMALLTQSLILLIMVVIFQISAHWIILAEERWCIEKFGAIYEEYMKSVRRYI